MSFKLLSASNTKIIKGEGKGYKTYILHLAPYTVAGRGNVCPKATPGCIAGCLNLSGHGGMIPKGETTNAVQRARIRKTQYFFDNRDQFMLDLAADIAKAIKQAARQGLIPVFRLNGTSDLSWEKYTVGDTGRNVFELFPDVQFYDYTAVLGRKIAQYPNYHLTFSRKESNDKDVLKALKMGLNVAAVYDKIPDGMYSADNDDLRFLDPVVGMMGLKVKGWRAKKDYSGFVIRLTEVA
jgi:hypothetical protein